MALSHPWLQKSARASITRRVQFTETDGARPPRVAKVCDSCTVGRGVLPEKDSEIARVSARFWSRDRHMSAVGAVYGIVKNLKLRKIHPLPLGEGRVRVSGFA